MIVRRYTPPTCTLVIEAQDSPLSRWVGQPTIKALTFELSFDDPRQGEDHRVTVQGDRTDLELLVEAVTNYVQDFLIHQEVPTLAAVPDAPNRPYLKANSLISHNLVLGHLASDSTGNEINLSATQLFDLATALDSYATEIVALPNLNKVNFSRPPLWGQAAALVVVTVGVTATALQMMDRYGLRHAPRTQVANAPSPTPTPTEQAVAIQPEALPSPIPTPTGIPTPPGGLVPPTPLLTPAPLPNLPPTVANPVNPPPNAQAGRPTIQIPATEPARPPANSAPSRIAVNPRPVPVNPRPAPAPAGRVPVITSAPPATPPRGGSNPSGNVASAPPNLLTTPPPLPDLPPIASAPAPRAEEPANQGIAASRGAAPESGGGSRGDRLFDTIPQVGEARTLLEQRWQPQADIKQPLQYEVLVNPDGTIERIRPLGASSAQYIERSGLPSPGQKFVSPLAGERKALIRVLLRPEGGVETFLEQQ